MPETQNLGSLQHISADAVGQPGQRRFRLRLITQLPQYAYVWLEKEQLAALKDAIVTILDEYDHGLTSARQDDFVFPLDVSSALYDMKSHCDKTIVGKIFEKTEAKKK